MSDPTTEKLVEMIAARDRDKLDLEDQVERLVEDLSRERDRNLEAMRDDRVRAMERTVETEIRKRAALQTTISELTRALRIAKGG